MTNARPPSIAINLCKSLLKWLLPTKVFGVQTQSRPSRNLSRKSLPWMAHATSSSSHYLGKSGGRFMAYISKPPSRPLPKSSHSRRCESESRPSVITKPLPKYNFLKLHTSQASFLRVYHFRRRRFLTEKSSFVSPLPSQTLPGRFRVGCNFEAYNHDF